MINHSLTGLPQKRLIANLRTLPCYLMAALLARMATGGAALGIVLLANAIGADGKTVGAFAACLTAPHVFGPVYGRWLDRAKDPRLIIIAAAVSYTLCFQLAVFGLSENLTGFTFATLLVCGMASSFLMGGLSTQLAPLVGDNGARRRRAQSWDTITYGFGLTMGPLVIALLSRQLSAQLSISLLMMLPACAALFVLCLPRPQQACQQNSIALSGPIQVFKTLYHLAPLKKTLIMTSGAAFSVAALPVIAIYLSESWQLDKTSGAYLATSYGIGCLCGAAYLIIAPLKSDAIVLLRNVGCLLLAMLLMVCFSDSLYTGLATYWLTGVANSIFFAVTLAARSEYAPSDNAAQIYMWVAAAKISAASLGAFLAGLLVDVSTTLPLLISCTVLASVIFACFVRKSENTE